jgi:hypothetical protein
MRRDRADAVRRAGAVLSLAASPVFAVMALLSLNDGSRFAETICGDVGHAMPLGGMTAMYLLMSAFHVAPWLTLWERSRPSNREVEI